MNIQYLLLYAVVLLMPSALLAQTKTQSYQEPEDFKISRMPVKSEQQIKARLFELGEDDANFYFRVNLQGDNFFIAEFNKISHWQANGALKEIFRTAANTATLVADSFSHPTASKKLDIHAPISGEPLTVRTRQYDDGSRMMAISGQTKNMVKVGTDTISLVKTYYENKRKKETELAQVKYSFILKSMEEIYNFSDNDALIADIEHTLDSLVQKKRGQWMADDAWFHGMQAEYSPGERDPKKRFRREMTSTALDAFDFQLQVGTTLLQNSLSGTAQWGVGYRWKSKRPNLYNRVGLSVSAMTYPISLETKPVLRGMYFADLEYGVLFKQNKTLVPIRDVSLSIGIKVANDADPIFDANIIRYGFNFNISDKLIVSPEYYFMSYDSEKDSDISRGFFGLSLKWRFATFSGN